MTAHQPYEEWTPPPGFAPISSKVPGIEVYAPAPEKGTQPGAKTFRCPQCSGIIAYDPDDRRLECPYCGYSQEVDAPRVGLSAERFEFTLEALDGSERGWGIERRSIHCEACSALFSADSGALSTTCPFCGSNRVVGLATLHDSIRPGYLIPFAIDQAASRARVREWLGKGWMHPPALRRVEAAGRLTGIYLPCWTFDAHIEASWRAEVGHVVERRVHRDGEWRTERRIEWRWQDGRVDLPIHNLLVPGSDRVSTLLQERLYPYDLQGLVAYDPSYLAGWQAQAYDVQLKPAWEVGKRAMREQAREACYDDIRSAHVRNFSMTADFGDERWRYVLLPVYMATYTFENQVYRVMVNGQTGAVAGQKPISWPIVWLAMGLALAPGVLLGVIGLITLLLGVGAFVLPIALILFVAGLVGAFYILRRARAADDV